MSGGFEEVVLRHVVAVLGELQKLAYNAHETPDSPEYMSQDAWERYHVLGDVVVRLKDLLGEDTLREDQP